MGLYPARDDWDNQLRSGFGSLDDLVAMVRRELCLTRGREPEIKEAIRDQVVDSDGVYSFPPLPLVTLWWRGEAPAD
jgi:hypothetical protein